MLVAFVVNLSCYASRGLFMIFCIHPCEGIIISLWNISPKMHNSISERIRITFFNPSDFSELANKSISKPKHTLKHNR